MAKRRHRGEDSTYRTCHVRYGCPPVVETTTSEGKTIRSRPPHAKSCRAPWAYSIDEGKITGKRVRRTVTAKTKPQLMEKVKALKEKQAHGVSPTAQTVGGWLDYWIERVAPETLRATTIDGYRSKINLYLKPALGDVRLQDLTPEHVERMDDWILSLDKGRDGGHYGTGKLSVTTVRQAHMVLRSALTEAATRRRIIYNPAAVVRAPKAADNPHDHLELDEAKLVLHAARDERELCRLVTALALGLRQGEALGLRWDDYRTNPDPYLSVQEAVQRIDGALTRTDVKSTASHRVIPIPPNMLPVFEAWRAKATDRYMFPGPNGGPCDAKHDWTLWGESLARAGVRRVPLHGARGSAASLLADMGVPDWRIAEILGQSQVAVTRRHYIKGTEESHRQALSGLLGELLP